MRHDSTDLHGHLWPAPRVMARDSRHKMACNYKALAILLMRTTVTVCRVHWTQRIRYFH